jgi:DNA mismatch repair protein MutL
MSRIALLPPETAQKIAAGEVIERPQSVVKELVENSLDAGATEIKVELVRGGRDLIRVTDNGQGMNREDALICFERHSTSKIAREDDLLSISTLGFRGEALPSISAVSRVTLKTSDREDEAGTLIRREGEKVLEVSDTAFPGGTCLEVRDLFYNLPVRKKFLRSVRAEVTRVTKYLIQACLAAENVRFSLFHEGRELFNYPAVPTLQERLYQVYGKSVLENLIPVEFSDEGMTISGYSSKPPSGRRDRSRQHIFVNRRPVKDSTVQAAFNQAYRGFLEKDFFAEGFLFLSLPFSEVDANVHPTKYEVRFKDSQAVFHLVFRAVREALLKVQGVKQVYVPEAEEGPRYHIKDHKSRASQAGGMGTSDRAEEVVRSQNFTLFPESEEMDGSFPCVLGQYQNMYIVAADEEGLLVVDQHNAHERLLFDKYEEIDRHKKWPKRLALLPVVFELSPPQILGLEEGGGMLEEMGFQVEHMGGRSYALKEYPDIFPEEKAREVLFALLEEIRGVKVSEMRHKVLRTLACRSAVKAGQFLPHEKMDYLVKELFKTSNPSLCPHGRPVVLRISLSEIEKGLKRE